MKTAYQASIQNISLLDGVLGRADSTKPHFAGNATLWKWMSTLLPGASALLLCSTLKVVLELRHPCKYVLIQQFGELAGEFAGDTPTASQSRRGDRLRGAQWQRAAWSRSCRPARGPSSFYEVHSRLQALTNHASSEKELKLLCWDIGL